MVRIRLPGGVRGRGRRLPLLLDPVISAQKLAPSDRGQGVFGTVVLITPSYLARGMLFTHVLRWGRAINLALYGRRVL